jgi:hypothetical protein
MAARLPLSVANAALQRAGGVGRLVAWDEDSDLAQGVRDLWPHCVDLVLGAAPWACTEQAVRLAKQAGGPADAPWTWRYLLPPERMEPPRRYFVSASDDRAFMALELRGDGVLADVEDLWCVVKIEPPPHQWPAYLAAVFTTALASLIASGLISNQQRAERLYQEAFGSAMEENRGGLMGQALLLEAQSKPARPFAGDDRGPLLRAWNSGWSDD